MAKDTRGGLAFIAGGGGGSDGGGVVPYWAIGIRGRGYPIHHGEHKLSMENPG